MELNITSIDNRKETNVSVSIFLNSLNKISTTYVCYLEAIPLASRAVIFLKYELTYYRERTDDNFSSNLADQLDSTSFWPFLVSVYGKFEYKKFTSHIGQYESVQETLEDNTMEMHDIDARVYESIECRLMIIYKVNSDKDINDNGDDTSATLKYRMKHLRKTCICMMCNDYKPECKNMMRVVLCQFGI